MPILRYAKAWSTLPPDERRARAGRVIDRWLRRDLRLRKLRLLPEPPSWTRLERALAVPLSDLPARLRRPDPARHSLHVDLETRAAAASKRREEAARIVAHATKLLDRNFDFLGSGPSRPLRPDGGIDWHRDFKSGIAWDPETYYLDVVTVRGDGSDAKVPWELSRFQHLLVLGQAYHLAPLVNGGEAEGLRGRLVAETVAQVDDWIVHNPRGLGVNWSCTMDVAIRAANWAAALALFRSAPELTDDFWRRVVRSLWSHGRHIRANLEIGSDGLTSNHYLSDIVGLLAIACFLPELRESESWRNLAIAALREEMTKQVHADGVDFERSIPYHRLVSELFLHGAILSAGSGEDLGDAYRARLASMLEFVAAYTRPDGSAPQWGDNDDGRFLPLAGYATATPHDHRHLLACGGRLLERPDLDAAGAGAEWEAIWLFPEAATSSAAPVTLPIAPSRAFPDAACFVLRSADVHIFVGCGPVGTRGLGNHSHNDLLSLSLWAGGREWITDPGTGTYTANPELRNILRSTASHATLQIDELEQNRFGSTLHELFKMEGAARPEVLAWHHDSNRAVLEARHHGFSPAGAAIAHRRTIRLTAGAAPCVIVDTIEEAGDEPAFEVRLRFPLPPDVRASIREFSAVDVELHPNLVELEDDAGRQALLQLDLPDSATVSLNAAQYSPRYGVVVPATCIEAVWPASDGLVARTMFRAVTGGGPAR